MDALNLFVIALISSSVGPIGATYYPRQPFIDPACQHGDCSWKFASPDGILTQSCSIMDVMDTGAFDGNCPNPFKTNLLPADRARPVDEDDITMEEYSKHFSEEVTGDPATAGNYTCLRIKYKLDQYGAGKLKGIQFSLRGMSQGDLNNYFCQNHDHGVNRTQYYAIEEYDDDHSHQTHDRREFTYECFCGIKPGSSYHFYIRTLPVDYGEQTDIHDTARLVKYPDDCTNPSSCRTKREDMRCAWNEQGKWYPRCRMQNQVQSGNYKKLQISFDPAPPELNFDRYKLLLYYHSKETASLVYTGVGVILDMNALGSDVTIDTGPTCNKESNRTLTTMLSLNDNYDKDCNYVTVVQAYPRIKNCMEDGRIKSCPASEWPQQFCVIGNPCDNSPCKDHGQCQPQGEQYTCNCNEGYMFMDNTCVNDPCSDDPCGENGVCNRHSTPGSMDRTYSYTCTCVKGYILSPDGETCIVDPCYVEPCTDFGTCIKVNNTLKPLMWEYTCHCNKGYRDVDQTCRADPCIANQTTPNVTPCGSVGECILISNSIDYNCMCEDGYMEGVNAEQVKTCMPINSTIKIVTAATLGTLGALTILILLASIFVMKSSSERVKKIREKLPFCKESADKPIYVPRIEPPLKGEKCTQLITSNPRIFILYSDDHEHHTDAVIKLATFLQNVCNCIVRLDMWCKTEIGDKKTWLYNEIHNADKVLLIVSKGTLNKWHAAMAQKPVDSSKGALGELGDMFWPGYKFATNEFESDPNLLKSKYVVAYFEYSLKKHVLPEVTNVALKFKLPENLEGLFFRLHNIPPCTPTSRRHARDLRPSSYASTSCEGHALFDAIEKMKATIDKNPDWYENPNSHETVIEYQPLNSDEEINSHGWRTNGENNHNSHGWRTNGENTDWQDEEKIMTSFFNRNESDNGSGSVCFSDAYVNVQAKPVPYPSDIDSGSVCFSDAFANVQTKPAPYPSDIGYESHNDMGTDCRLRNDSHFGLSGNLSLCPESDESNLEIALRANTKDSDNDSVLSHRNDQDGCEHEPCVLSHRNDRDGCEHEPCVLSHRNDRDGCEHEPFLFKTLDPQDVEIHPHPPLLDRMDSGFGGYMSDYHINTPV